MTLALLMSLTMGFGDSAHSTVAPRTAGGQANAAQGAKLRQHYQQLEKYGQGGTKQLQNGRTRYYGKVKPADKPGTMAGARRVREWDPSAGQKRTWFETVDQNGNVRIVRPETGGDKVHFTFDEFGNSTGTF